MQSLVFRYSTWMGLFVVLASCVAPSTTKTVASGTVKNPGMIIKVPQHIFLSHNHPWQLWIDVKDQKGNLIPGDINVKVINHSRNAVSFDKVQRQPDGKKHVQPVIIDPGESAVVYSGSNMHGCVTTVYPEPGQRQIEFELLLPKDATEPLNYKITADRGDGP